MKQYVLILIALAFTKAVSAQTNVAHKTNIPATEIKVPALDKSPLDMAYFPADYPMIKTQNKTSQPPLARVLYSRPQRDNRNIFGELIEYGKVWRLGANEATEIEFFRDVRIGGKKIPKGRYTLYAIPTTTSWTLILNKDTDTWGAFIYDSKKDVVRTELPIQQLDSPVEPFSMSFNKTSTGANLFIAWDKVAVTLPIEIK